MNESEGRTRTIGEVRAYSEQREETEQKQPRTTFLAARRQSVLVDEYKFQISYCMRTILRNAGNAKSFKGTASALRETSLMSSCVLKGARYVRGQATPGSDVGGVLPVILSRAQASALPHRQHAKRRDAPMVEMAYDLEDVGQLVGVVGAVLGAVLAVVDRVPVGIEKRSR